ncbi:MAG: thioredoxin domain-containing protein [Sphingobacteriia bacterium]|nr:thioredoxin domain-containing protein [Sphingobacteriia bacterium]
MKKYFLILMMMVSKISLALDYNKLLDSDYVLGNRDAKVQIIMYSSLTCPHCATFYTKTFPKLQQAYIDNNKIAFVNRSILNDRVSLAGTMLAYCEGEKDYYKIIKVLSKQFEHWVISSEYLNRLENIASLAGYDKNKFEKCMNNEYLQDQLLRSQKEATSQLNIDVIPFMLINGKPYKGAHGFEYLSKEIEELLK